MRVWTPKVKDLKFPTSKKQGAFFWRNPQINKVHVNLNLNTIGAWKNNLKKNQTRTKEKLKVWVGV